MACPIPFWDKYLRVSVVYESVRDRGAGEWDGWYLGSQWLLALMCFRIYFLVRTLVNHSIFASPSSRRICHNYGFTQSIRFTLKSQIIDKPERTTFLLLIISINWFAYLIRIFEQPFYRM